MWISRRAPRTSRVRAFAVLWGGWLLVTGVVFSYMQGIIHPYYMVALAPAIGALVGVGAIALLQSGMTVVGRAVAAVGVLVTGVWAASCSSGRPGGCRGCGGRCCWRGYSARSRSSRCPSCSAGATGTG